MPGDVDFDEIDHCEPDGDYDGEEREEPQVTCIACCCVIGDEVAYGDDWGEGPLCTRCAGLEEGNNLSSQLVDRTSPDARA